MNIAYLLHHIQQRLEEVNSELMNERLIVADYCYKNINVPIIILNSIDKLQEERALLNEIEDFYIKILED